MPDARSGNRELRTEVGVEQRSLNDTLEQRVEVEIENARLKALDSLSRYKFQMFGYWAAIWVHLNRLHPVMGGRPNPFGDFVRMARRQRGSSDGT